MQRQVYFHDSSHYTVTGEIYKLSLYSVETATFSIVCSHISLSFGCKTLPRETHVFIKINLKDFLLLTK